MAITDRIEVLQADYQQGAQTLRDLQGQIDELTARQVQVRQGMLRIEGAIAELNHLRQEMAAASAAEAER